MSERRAQVALWLVSLGVLSAVACSLDNPGSMDACYHMHVAQNLRAGRGMVSDAVFQYLEGAGAGALPLPSHRYWMPLPAWLAWLGLLAFDRVLSPFAAAQVPFVLLASCIPLLAYRVARELWGREEHARLAFALALLSPNYLQTWVVPDSVTPFCLASGLCFLQAARAQHSRDVFWAGTWAGVAGLARADAPLLLLACAALVARERTGRFERGAALGAGYLLLVTPWVVRNAWGAEAPTWTVVLRTAWLRRYDEFFSYQLDLTPAHFWGQGFAASVRARAGDACAVFVQFFEIFQGLLPLLAWLGGRVALARGARWPRLCALYGLALLTCMALVFPHPAQHGSLFRGASALVPWGAALVPAGLSQVAAWWARLRRVNAEEMFARMRAGLITGLFVAACACHVQRLYGVFPNPERLWNARLSPYVEVDRWLRAHGEGGPVLVADPPAFTLSTGRPSLMIPSDGPDAVLAVAARYGARYLVLEANVPSLAATYRGEACLLGFAYVRSFRDELGLPIRLFARAERATAECQPWVVSRREDAP